MIALPLIWEIYKLTVFQQFCLLMIKNMEHLRLVLWILQQEVVMLKVLNYLFRLKKSWINEKWQNRWLSYFILWSLSKITSCWWVKTSKSNFKKWSPRTWWITTCLKRYIKKCCTIFEFLQLYGCKWYGLVTLSL
jgi:hypothetical protein